MDILGYAVLGGSGQWFGPILGAGLLTALPLILRDSLAFLKNFSQLPNILNGLALMLVIIFMPGGLASIFRRSPLKPGPRRIRHQARLLTQASPSAPDGLEHAEKVEHIERPLLSLLHVSRSFGGVEALVDLSFNVEAGRIHGLIGPNGAGKTTLINAISGIIPATSGRIIWEGEDIQDRPQHLIARSGIARTYQNIQLFPEMSALDNVIVGHHTRIRSKLGAAWLRLPLEAREESKARAESLALLERLGLGSLADQDAGKLSYGDQRRVEIARALATHPRLLLLDEPAAGMNEGETEALGQFISELRGHGYTLLVVEHHMDLIMKICDTIIVLNFGRKIAEGVPDSVSKDEAVLEAYLGRE